MPAAQWQPNKDRLARWAETPWAWLALFALVALVGSMVIAPKYARRQARLERRFEARREAARRQMTGEQVSPLAEESPAVDPEDERARLVPIGALQLFVMLLAVVFIVLGWRATSSLPPPA